MFIAGVCACFGCRYVIDLASVVIDVTDVCIVLDLVNAVMDVLSCCRG